MPDPVTTLALATDVVLSLGRPLVGVEDDRTEQLLSQATAEVNSWTGYKFLPGDYTITRFGDEEFKLDMPAVVESIDEVRSINQFTGAETVLVLGTDYTVRNSSIYLMRAHRTIEIDFSVADATTVPEEVVALVANMVARSLAGPPVGATSESAGPYSVSYANTSGDVYLSKNDKLILRKYRQNPSAITIGRQ
jgi:hypothetical protein